MFDSVDWALPLVILPGVALLIMSTSIRVNQMHTEVHRLLDDRSRATATVMKSLRRRSILFRKALLNLYLSVGLFALAGILGVITAPLPSLSGLLVISLTGLGIVCVLFAAYSLTRESAQAVVAIQEHIEQIDSKAG